MATNCVRRVTLTGVTRLPRRTFVPTCRQFAKSQSLRYASDTGAASAGGAAAPAATTTTAAAETAKEAPKKSGRGLRRTVLGTSLALTLLVGWVYGSDTRASIHRYGAVQLIRTLFPDAEDAHHIGVDALRMLYKYGLHPRERGDPDGDGALETEVFGYKLSNPIGISGGLDKHGEIPDPLFAVGPAIVEVGGTTPLPQDGNPRPRVFRLPSQKAMINRVFQLLECQKKR